MIALMPLLFIGLGASLVTIILHLGTSILIDGQIRLGVWGKLGLAIFTILGPLGTLLELWLLTAVLRDIYRLNRTARNCAICSHSLLACNGHNQLELMD